MPIKTLSPVKFAIDYRVLISSDLFAFLPSRVEDLGGEVSGPSICGGHCGLYCDVLQHPGRRPPDGQPGALHSLPPRSAGLELPLHTVAGRNPEMVAGCETSRLYFPVNSNKIPPNFQYIYFLCSDPLSPRGSRKPLS